MPCRESPYDPHCPEDASKKTPQPFRRGEVGGMDNAARLPDPSPAKGDPGKLPVGPVSWLPVTNLLSAPSRGVSPSGLGANFVTGYSCGAAMELHHLPDTHDRAPDGNFLFLIYLYSLPFCGVSTIRGHGIGRGFPSASVRSGNDIVR